MSDSVLVSVSGRVMEVSLNRPPVNAITVDFSYELFDAFKQLNDTEDLRCGILYGGDNDKGIFSAGWDLKAFAAGEEQPNEDGSFDLGPGGLGGLPEFFDLYKPVIAALDGHAIGGGFELALGADLIVMAEDAYFSLPEMQRGFLPDAGAIQKLHHRVPYNVAVDLMLTGRRLYADEAKHWGLVRDVVPKGAVLDKAREIASGIAEGAPLVSRAFKEFMRHNAYTSPEEAHQASRVAWLGRSEMPIYEEMLKSDDFKEGPAAFAEKRPPDFKGR